MKTKTKPTKVNERKNASGTGGNPVPQAELWRSFYALGQHWISDLKFFEDELNFFRILFDKNLSVLIEPINIDKTREMVSRITALEKHRVQLHDKVLKHAEHITLLIENSFSQDAQKIKDEHGKLEDAFVSFVKAFRSIKSEVFALTQRLATPKKLIG